ncbi:hypothetical protein NSTC745_07048 [Nostoc sp. DSM 114161]|jgi:hypothetical protein
MTLKSSKVQVWISAALINYRLLKALLHHAFNSFSLSHQRRQKKEKEQWFEAYATLLNLFMRINFLLFTF